MIHFECSQCRMKFKVKPEFAGRKSKCPTCKQPIVVPAPDQTVGYVPAGQIDGTVSSVHQAGVDGGVTLGSVGGPSTSGHKSVGELLSKGKPSGQRYMIESEIARGGMGAVLRAIDCDIRREVAVKYMLNDKDARAKARFVEEAQITGQLEHPNIVPIHELGVDAKKRLFFSMKMIKGRSLAQVLDELRKNPKSAENDYPLARLLNVLVGVCHGLAYAHARGVVNRDVKPANVMIGDFGEVYVMDWGLAKVVLGGSSAGTVTDDVEAERFAQFMKDKSPGATATDSGVSSSSAARVSTSGRDDADLTQEGSVLGTPVYMPPEQAMGEIAAIDHRSDIYSLGAMLYEMLTLLPPVEKEGGFVAILPRVAQGAITPPEQRAPQRAARIPRELSAIAMKALARNKKDRYQTVEELRQDIERFQEGRSVSAKEDTKTEMLWKFAKRNKGFSAGVAVALLVLFASVWFIGKAWIETNRAYAAYRKEQDDRRTQARASVPAFVRAADLLIKENQLDDAMAQVATALEIEPDSARAHLLRGQMLLAAQRYDDARQEFEHTLRIQPGDTPVRKLLELSRATRPDDSGKLLALADELARQKAFSLAEQVTRQAEKLLSSRQDLLAHYQKNIDAVWNGRGAGLAVDEAGKFSINFYGAVDVRDLAPLQGMPVSSLILGGCVRVHDLTPLKGMPLTNLNIEGCTQVRDLTPLQGMPLASLKLSGTQVRDLTPLQNMPLDKLIISGCPQLSDLTPLHGLPLTVLDARGCALLTDLGPLQGLQLVELDLGFNPVKDLKPLKGMPLKTLSLYSCNEVQDLGPLRGMPLTSLNLGDVQKHDVTPLTGMKLTQLTLPSMVTDNDLAVIAGMPLTDLNLENCPEVRNLTFLRDLKLTHLKLPSGTTDKDLLLIKGLPLKMLSLSGCVQIRDLTPLQDLPLTTLSLKLCRITDKDLSILKGMPLKYLDLSDCDQLTDLTALHELKLETLLFPPATATKGIDGIRRMKSLQTIGPQTGVGYSRDDFWKRYDAGEFKK